MPVGIQWLNSVTARKQKKWHAPIYGFFKPTPDIEYKDNRRSHVFRCLAKGCSGVVRRFVDNDASTSNLIRHARKCFGEDTVKAAKNAKDAREVRDKIVGSILRDGTITAVFQRKDREKVSYSHRQHTRTETRLVALHTCRAPVDSLDRAELVRWVAESNRPFHIVEDRGFQCLMKTGRPAYYLPSPSTISRDVRQVFARTRTRIAKILQVRGRID